MKDVNTFANPTLLTLTAISENKMVELNVGGLWLKLHDKVTLPIQVPYDAEEEEGIEYINHALSSISVVPAFNDVSYQPNANAMVKETEKLFNKFGADLEGDIELPHTIKFESETLTVSITLSGSENEPALVSDIKAQAGHHVAVTAPSKAIS